jgi:uncharacterized membrane protein YkvA (DUF1232 family)
MTEPMADEQQSNAYSEQKFWQKLQLFAAQAGRNVVEKALMLYYVAQRPETPLWAKMVIFSSLAYFILPADAIPDIIPVAGYADDLSMLARALTAVARSITPEVKAAARQTAQEWIAIEPPAPRDRPQASDPIREIVIE